MVGFFPSAKVRRISIPTIGGRNFVEMELLCVEIEPLCQLLAHGMRLFVHSMLIGAEHGEASWR